MPRADRQGEKIDRLCQKPGMGYQQGSGRGWRTQWACETAQVFHFQRHSLESLLGTFLQWFFFFLNIISVQHSRDTGLVSGSTIICSLIHLFSKYL